VACVSFGITLLSNSRDCRLEAHIRTMLPMYERKIQFDRRLFLCHCPLAGRYWSGAIWTVRWAV